MKKKNRRTTRQRAMAAIVEAEAETELRAIELERRTDSEEETRAREDAPRVRSAPVNTGPRREAAIRQMHRLVPGNPGRIA